MLVNSFEELESEYVGVYREATGRKVWCIGPVSLCNKESADKAERGNRASIDKNKCLEWLDSRLPGSVIYVCFGSINRLTPLQQIEIGLALEASNKNFIWVIRGGYKPEETEKWLTEYGFEERVKGRGLLIRGWSPQILILSHPAIGGFLTHCGWNSTLEGISAGMPMVTWPLISEQFYNEKLIVNVLNIGVSVGNPVVMHVGEEDTHEVSIHREEIKKAIENLMDTGEEGKQRRERARKLATMAEKAIEEEGSSTRNISLLIQDIIHLIMFLQQKMASPNHILHFILIPHLAQGHQIPMIDLGRLLAQRGVVITIITTPISAAKFRAIIERSVKSGLQINLLEVPFPSLEVGLPENCESMDALPSHGLMKNLLLGIQLLQKPVEQLLDEIQPRPNCIISDRYMPWTRYTADKLGIPKIMFDGMSSFSLLCIENTIASRIHETISESESFTIPGLPDRIELTKSQLPNAVNMVKSDPLRVAMREAELAAYGVVVNSFEELESAYVEELRRKRGSKVWCVGPVSLCNKEDLDKAERGEKASIDTIQFLNWLDSKEPSSVIYVCLGSQSRLSAPQMVELGLGLEASNHSFIWIFRKGKETEQFERWMEAEKFEIRVKGRGILIRGWAPQVLILSHPAIGGFLTHCGWNSTLEGVSAGVPMVTWPMFAEQFFNERFIVQVEKIGVSLGSKLPVKWGEADKGRVAVKGEDIKKAVEELMDVGEEGDVRRENARKLGEIAKMAIEEGGSSYLNLTLLIEDILKQISSRD